MTLKNLKLFLICISVLLIACSNKEKEQQKQDLKEIIKANNAYSHIKWTNINDLDLLMQKSPKKVMIYFYRSGCPYCKEMKETTFKNQKVIKLLNDNFYAVMFDGRTKENAILNTITYVNKEQSIDIASNHELHTALVDPYNKNIYWPSTVFLNEKYEKLRSFPGLQKQDNFPKVLENMMRR